MRNRRFYLTQSHPQRSKRRRAGAALIEFAVVLLLLMTIILGDIEFSAYGKNALTIANACREGARAASIGRTTAQIKDRIKRSSSPLSVESPSGLMKLEVSSGGTGTYVDLTDKADMTANAASANDLIRITVTTRNRAVTGAFGTVFNRDLRSEVIMRRER